ncbi:MAG: tyrosine-type recombinase/integrase [Acidobacteriota bacterium]|nr:tyrosine-type recombinase/integrase [Acidobacteriota bacterium]
MAKQLSAKFVRTVSRPGKYGDQHGLILRVKPSGSKQWIWRGTVRGQRVDLGLGGHPYTSLKEARERAFSYRKLARAGGDPRTLSRTVPTFEAAAEKVIKIRRARWRPGSKSEAQWRASLRDYAMPRLGQERIDTITTADVMAVLLPIWSEKPETARRVRQRIAAIMRWAIEQSYRPDDPAGPALGAALPKHYGQQRHSKALPPSEVATALSKVRESKARMTTKLAFEFLVLTAARSGEVRAATWAEVDFDEAVWTVPAARTKAGRPHRVPLSFRAFAVLEEARQLADDSGLIFPSTTGLALSSEALSKLVRELGVPAVPDGFRTAFRGWCAETGVSREVAEACLAHAIRDKAEAAYQRSDLLEARRKALEAWSEVVRASLPGSGVLE